MACVSLDEFLSPKNPFSNCRTNGSEKCMLEKFLMKSTLVCCTRIAIKDSLYGYLKPRSDPGYSSKFEEAWGGDGAGKQER